MRRWGYETKIQWGCGTEEIAGKRAMRKWDSEELWQLGQ
jgi:hypothetical protein